LSVENRIRAVLGCLSGPKGFGLEYGQAGCNFWLGFRLKPKRRIWAARHGVKSPVPKSSSPKLVAEDHLGATKAVPPALTQSVGSGSSPVSSSAFPLVALSPEDGVRTRSSSEVRQNPPVCLSEEVAHSQAEEPAPQARLDEPEPSDAGIPVQVHQIEDAVAGSNQGTISEAKMSLEVIPAKAICTPEKAPSLIRRGFFGPRAVSPISSRGSSQGNGALSSSLPEISVLSLGAAEVGCNPTISKSEVVYARRVKKETSKQPLKNKEILAKVVADIPAE
jgi:hypothetical protein